MASNGRLNTSGLVDVGGGKLLRADAARAWVALVAAAFAATGIRLTLTEGYRTYARQVYLYALYKSGLGNVAAKPGTSNHGLGVAVDMGNYGSVRMWAWLSSNAPRYGWSWAQGKASGEAWHWVYVVGGSATAGAIGTVIGEYEMSQAETDKIIADQAAIKATLANIESILTLETRQGVPGGLRGTVEFNTRIGQNIESILTKETINTIPGGLRGVIHRIVKKTGA